MIDGAGKWLIPGLADMHVHTWYEDDLVLFLAAGVTTVRNMWGVPQHLAWRSQIARGERLGPTMVTAGGLIDGAPPDWPGSIVLTRPEAAEPLVIERRPDAGGHRVFAITTTRGGTTVTSELVVDRDGFIVARTDGAPIDTTSTRRR